MLRRNKLIAISGSVGVVAVAVAAVALAQPRTQQRTSEEAPAVHREIEQTLGVVPSFIKAYPEIGVIGAWEQMKALELNPDTALSGKQKELIGLGVAAQIPCDYCSYFHTEAARLNGASDAEIAEAIAVAAQTMHWSTVMIGLTPEDAASVRMSKIIENMGEGGKAKRPANVTSVKSAEQDIRATFGTVPTHLQRFPRPALAGAWRSYRDVVMSGQTELPPQTKQLIATAVATQAACRDCIQLHGQAAKQAGASDQQIAEAVTMAAVTRHWSTVLNGNLVSEKQFRAETQQIMRHLKQRQRRQSQR